MFGLSPLGLLHTAVSLFALVVATWMLWCDGEISPRDPLGWVYTAATSIAALTAFGLSRHGGFGPGHVLAVLTLLALALGLLSAHQGVGGRWARHLQAACFSATLLFHAIPGITETLTRLPPGAPWLPGPEAPAFKPVFALLLLLFLAGLAWQWRRISRSQGSPPTRASAMAGKQP